ncbi:MAG TPA: YdiU family protein [Pirellulaceae bacterium]|nr:YdiU family protein [Pirellulaceae bacterium]
MSSAGETVKSVECPRMGWNFDNSYARLPESLFVRATPATVRLPRIAVLNESLASELGLDFTAASPDDVAKVLVGNLIPPGADPIAQAYAGHQFGHFTMLGDGRAILLGEQVDPRGRRFDIQFKGSGRTRFSRNGDGRAALGPMLREYIISEAMAAYGIPTTRSLAVVTTGEPVFRESILRGAVLTRVAASHIRVGTFECLAARRDDVGLRALADHTIARHYPELAELSGDKNKYLELFRAVVARQASLIARWMLVGFVHGVMNTDNMAISGESIDYGPCAFMDAYDSDTVFSSIDHQGRYAYGNQPNIAQWNLARLAEAILSLIDAEPKRAVELVVEQLREFGTLYRAEWQSGMRAKLGLQTEEADDAALIETLLDWMERNGADYTNTLRLLSTAGLHVARIADDAVGVDRTDGATSSPPAGPGLPAETFGDPTFAGWLERWKGRLAREGSTLDAAQARMRRCNPSVIPRNHRVEEALATADENDDFSLLNRLLAALRDPYGDSPMHAEFRDPPPPGQCRYQTFCGT